MPEFVYQLRATGSSLNGWSYDGRTSTVFRTKEAAEQRIPAYKAKLTDRANIDAVADDKNLRIFVVALEIID
jgi:hypothetical protein